MRELWSEQRKFEIWLEIETLACEAMAEIGQIPQADAAEIRKRARFSIPEINEIEKRTNHDVIAFLENVATLRRPGRALDAPGADVVGYSRHDAGGADRRGRRGSCWKTSGELRARRRPTRRGVTK